MGIFFIDNLSNVESIHSKWKNFWKDRKVPLDHPKYDEIFFNSAEAFNDLLRNEGTLQILLMEILQLFPIAYSKMNF